MVTAVDEGRGLVKVCWADVRDRVAKVEPTFARLVDELSPDKSFPLYLAYYPYGECTGNTQTTFLPREEGGYDLLSNPNLSKDIIKHLGYGMDSAPLGMVLEKQLEFFVDLRNEGITIPLLIYSAGMFFPFSRVLSRKNARIYSANAILSAASGGRSVFMLPNIGCATNHSNLQRDFNIQDPPPKQLYDHWRIFKRIIASNIVECDWRACVLYFSEKWINKLYKDKTWVYLKIYLHELGWKYTEYRRNHFCYDLAFSMIQRMRNLKPNPYLADTARHLFTTSIGAAPGYVPANNNDALPLNILQKVFLESYGLKKYYPTILQPAHFNFEEDRYPIYYSLQNPSTHMFSPKSREVSSTLCEMRELEHIMRIFTEELAKDDGMCANTIMSKVAKSIRFNYFHNKPDRHRVVQSSAMMASLDKRFSFISEECEVNGAKFSCDSAFVRGCIGINAGHGMES